LNGQHASHATPTPRSRIVLTMPRWTVDPRQTPAPPSSQCCAAPPMHNIAPVPLYRASVEWHRPARQLCLVGLTTASGDSSNNMTELDGVPFLFRSACKFPEISGTGPSRVSDFCPRKDIRETLRADVTSRTARDHFWPAVGRCAPAGRRSGRARPTVRRAQLEGGVAEMNASTTMRGPIRYLKGTILPSRTVAVPPATDTSTS
jgi:hypothetical protein